MNYEVFKPVVGYEDLYEVSNKSTIRSKTRKVVYSDGRVYLYKSKTIKSQVSGTTPYPSVTLTKNKMTKRISVHIIVCSAFNGVKPFNNAEVNHIDEDPTNNDSENLEWVTSSQNKLHSARYGDNKGSFKRYWATPFGVYSTLDAAALVSCHSRGDN